MGQPTPPADPAEPTTEPAKNEPPATGDGLGESGKKALEAERNARKELEKQVRELRERDPLKELLAKLGEKPEPGQDPTAALQARIAAMEERAANAELAQARAEVAAAKGLTPAQAARLQGSTREELEADAEQLKQLFPSSATPGTPAPDPTQGARGGANDLDAQIAAAEAKGRAGVRDLIRLKEEKAAQARK